MIHNGSIPIHKIPSKVFPVKVTALEGGDMEANIIIWYVSPTVALGSCLCLPCYSCFEVGKLKIQHLRGHGPKQFPKAGTWNLGDPLSRADSPKELRGSALLQEQPDCGLVFTGGTVSAMTLKSC